MSRELRLYMILNTFVFVAVVLLLTYKNRVIRELKEEIKVYQIGGLKLIGNAIAAKINGLPNQTKENRGYRWLEKQKRLQSVRR